MDNAHDWFRRQGLVRDRQNRVLAGVCAGLGRRFGIDPWPSRLLFLLLILALHGSLIVMYVILWILMPAEGTAPDGTASRPPSTFPTA